MNGQGKQYPLAYKLDQLITIDYELKLNNNFFSYDSKSDTTPMAWFLRVDLGFAIISVKNVGFELFRYKQVYVLI